MGVIRDFDQKHQDSAVWQFIKFNLVSTTIFWVQLLLANVLPLLFDSLREPLPGILRGIFRPENMDAKYVVNGAVTWGYVLPFFLSNFLANIYGYFVNMKATFKGKGGKYSLPVYCAVLFVLILFSTWLQSIITTALSKGSLAALARTIAAAASGMVQMIVIFPLEKFVLFKKDR